LAFFIHENIPSGHIELSLLVIHIDETRRKDVTVNEKESLAHQFEGHRARLKAVAYRMLGSLSEADDAVQEAWLRLNRASAGDVVNLGGWLTTVVARVSLDMLRARKSRREDPLSVRLPDPIIGEDKTDPAHEILLADSVGLALLVVLETLAPAERLAFVLHDMFGVSFDEIASIVGRSSTAARQLASRARRRVQGATKIPDADISAQRKIVDAFMAAARDGNFDALLDVLDPDVVVRADRGAALAEGGIELRGARVVAKEALRFSKMVQFARPMLVNGSAGIVSWLPGGEPFSIMGFTIRRGKIVEINIFTDPARLRRLNLSRPAGRNR
jgi:RNA polymerase sigma-70 factor, ECF subfamily